MSFGETAAQLGSLPAPTPAVHAAAIREVQRLVREIAPGTPPNPAAHSCAIRAETLPRSDRQGARPGDQENGQSFDIALQRQEPRRTGALGGARKLKSSLTNSIARRRCRGKVRLAGRYCAIGGALHPPSLLKCRQRLFQPRFPRMRNRLAFLTASAREFCPSCFGSLRLTRFSRQ